MLPRTVLLLTLSAGLVACAPRTTIRRSALIPAASAPLRAGTELRQGEARLAGHMTAINTGEEFPYGLDPRVPEVGDPGVFIPDFHLGASAYFGLAGGLELGGQFQYASLGWAHPNAVGVLPLPQDEDLFMGGVGARYNFPVQHPRLRFAALGELNFATIPQAVYLLDRTASAPTYRFERMDHERFTLGKFGLQLGWELVDQPLYEVLAYVMGGTQQSVTNIGFDNDLSNLDESTLESFWMGYLGVGFDAVLESFTVGASFYVPFEDVERLEFGPSFSVHVGAVLD